MNENPGMMKLSEHFWLHEFTRSAKARSLGIANEPPSSVVDELIRLAAQLEKVRALCAKILGYEAPIRPLSGYRCPSLNDAVGGSPGSAHMVGRAVDFDPPPGITHDQLQHAIKDARSIDFEKVIEEKALDGSHWLHFQIPMYGVTGRRKIVDAALNKQGGKIVRYTVG